MNHLLDKNALNIPNLLTVLRIALLPVIAWRFRMGDSLGAMIVYLLAMLTDAADGAVARRAKQITPLGMLLDPIADKLSLLTLLLLFVRDNQIPKWYLDVVFAKEIVLILGGAAALRFNIVVSALPLGKLSTLSFVLSTLSRFMRLRVIADLFLWLALALSVLAFIQYAASFFKQLQMQKVIL